MRCFSSRSLSWSWVYLRICSLDSLRRKLVNIRLADKILLHSHTQTWVAAHTQRHGSIIIEPNLTLSESQLVTTNKAVAHVFQNVLLAGIFGDSRAQLHKGQVLSYAIPHLAYTLEICSIVKILVINTAELSSSKAEVYFTKVYVKRMTASRCSTTHELLVEVLSRFISTKPSACGSWILQRHSYISNPSWCLRTSIDGLCLSENYLGNTKRIRIKCTHAACWWLYWSI